MIRRTAIVPLVSVSFLGSCTPPGDLVVGPGARLEPPVSSSLFTAAVEHLARDARGHLLVDPRPLRPGAHLSGVDAEDLAPGAEDVTRKVTRPPHGVFTNRTTPRCHSSPSQSPR